MPTAGRRARRWQRRHGMWNHRRRVPRRAECRHGRVRPGEVPRRQNRRSWSIRGHAAACGTPRLEQGRLRRVPGGRRLVPGARRGCPPHGRRRDGGAAIAGSDGGGHAFRRGRAERLERRTHCAPWRKSGVMIRPSPPPGRMGGIRDVNATTRGFTEFPLGAGDAKDGERGVLPRHDPSCAPMDPFWHRNTGRGPFSYGPGIPRHGSAGAWGSVVHCPRLPPDCRKPAIPMPWKRRDDGLSWSDQRDLNPRPQVARRNERLCMVVPAYAMKAEHRRQYPLIRSSHGVFMHDHA